MNLPPRPLNIDQNLKILALVIETRVHTETNK